MNIIDRYIARETFRYFTIVLGTVIGLYLAIDFFDDLDEMVESGLPLLKTLILFLFKLPIDELLPVCIFLAILITFSLMTRNNELVALKSSGISVYYLLKPVIVIGFLFSISLFFISEFIIPATKIRANRIWRLEVKKKGAAIIKRNNIWIKGERSIAHIKHYDPVKKSIFGITLNYFNSDFDLIKRIDAERGVFQDGKWFFYGVMEQKRIVEHGDYKITFHKVKAEPFDFLPDDFNRVVKKSEEMSFRELLVYSKKVEREGYDATAYKVDLYAKMAFPFVCLILCLSGTGIAINHKINGNLPVTISLGIGIAFLYWTFYGFCLSLGYGGVIHPLVAAWIANLLFLCFGILMLLFAE